MVTLEDVEKLCSRTNLSYDEAKLALEEANGDILEAIINLEKQNRIEAPKGNGYYSSETTQNNPGNKDSGANFKTESNKNRGTSFGELVVKFFKWCGKIVDKGNRNNLEIIKDGNKVMDIPVTVLALLLIFLFWITIPMMIVGLFLGYSYRFIGADLGKENVNRAMDSVAEMAQNLKKEVKGEKSHGENSDN